MSQNNTLIQPFVLLDTRTHITNDCFTTSPTNMYFYELQEPLTFSLIPSPYTEVIIAYNASGNGCIYCVRCSSNMLTLTPDSFSHYFCIRFDDNAFYTAADFPFSVPASLLNQTIRHTPKNGSPEDALIRQLQNTTSFPERIHCFIDYLNNRMSVSFCPPGVSMVRHTIRETDGFVTMNELSAITGYSNRHINRIFTAYFGYGPKEYCKLVRFHKALSEIVKDPQRNNSQFITQIGYSDQAHFQREFKMYMGETPRQFIKQLM